MFLLYFINIKIFTFYLLYIFLVIFCSFSCSFPSFFILFPIIFLVLFNHFPRSFLYFPCYFSRSFYLFFSRPFPFWSPFFTSCPRCFSPSFPPIYFAFVNFSFFHGSSLSHFKTFIPYFSTFPPFPLILISVRSFHFPFLSVGLLIPFPVQFIRLVLFTFSFSLFPFLFTSFSLHINLFLH